MIDTALTDLARKHGARVALRDPQAFTEVSFAQMAQNAANLRETLGALQIAPTSVIAFVSDRPILSALLFLALSAECVAAPISARVTGAEAQRHLALLRPAALVIAGDVPEIEAAADALAIPCLRAGADSAGDLRLTPDPEAVIPGANARQVAGKGLILTTSGTTGTPKLVALDQRRLHVGARTVASTLGLSEQDIGIEIMPLHHIHGLIAGLLAPVLSGAETIVLPSPEPGGFLQAASAHRASWYTAVPTMHRAILRQAQTEPDLAETCALRAIRSSSSALPSEVRQGLKDLFACPVIEAYGMTEATHQIASQSPAGPNQHGDVGLPEPGRVRIADADGHSLPQGQVGDVLIHGESVIDGYLDNAAATAESVVDGWLRTGDIGKLNDAGALVLVGRKKEIVKRGGAQVAPMEIEEALLAQPGVVDAIAFGVSHPSLGQDLAAAVVIDATSGGDARQLRNALLDSLSDYKVPSRIIQLDEIPKGPTGKPRRLDMETLLADALSGEYAAPRSPTESLVAALFEETLGKDRVGRDEDFFLAGGDSLSGTSMMFEINKLVATSFSPETLFRCPTPAELAAHIDGIDGGRVKRLIETLMGPPNPGTGGG